MYSLKKHCNLGLEGWKQGGWGGLGRPTFRAKFFFLVLVGSHRTSSEAWSYLGLARAVAHSYERERGVVRDTI